MIDQNTSHGCVVEKLSGGCAGWRTRLDAGRLRTTWFQQSPPEGLAKGQLALAFHQHQPLRPWYGSI